MKKRMVSLAVTLLSLGSVGFAAVPVKPPVITISLDKSFTSLVVDDHITVVLTNETGTDITLSGDPLLVKKVKAAVQKGALNIWLPGSDKGENVIVYVPAQLLRQLIVNGGSHISTAATLDNTRLEVIVNGACKLDLRSRGTIDVTGTGDYEFKKK